MEKDEPVRPLNAQDADLKGTAAADARGGRFLDDLARIIGLDDERYWIVGIEFGDAEHDPDIVEILAIDRTETGISGPEDLQRGSRDGVPVVSFRIHGLSLLKLLREGLRRLEVQRLSEALPPRTTLRRVRFDDLEA